MRYLLMLFTLSVSIGLAAPQDGAAGTDDARKLREQLESQDARIEELRKEIAEQSKTLKELAAKTDAQTAKPESVSKGLGGFQFSGDFRLRLDAQVRSANETAFPLQNVRSRYRVRLNIDKQIDPRFKFHFQLSTGALNNGLTNDQDMAGLTTKHPFSISEAYVKFQPTENITLRGGRMDEVFADNMRFLWDDDVRFNGFDQTARVPFGRNDAGFKSIEFRMSEYILTNPAVYILSSSSPYVNAGYEVGQKVRDSILFHPGVVLKGELTPAWSHQVVGGVEIYRNPNQIQLASTTSGYPVLVNGAIGIVLSSAPGGTGNGTTASGGAIYSADDYHVAHLGYRIERKGVRIAGREMPLFFDFQAARNMGADALRDSVMASVNLGSVKKAGDVRALYQFAIKDANSMISQFTDDDLGTGSGVNVAVHGFRVDVGLTRFLQLQNLLFVQHQRRTSNPSGQFFVPLQAGANATFRYLGQLAFTF